MFNSANTELKESYNKERCSSDNKMSSTKITGIIVNNRNKITVKYNRNIQTGLYIYRERGGHS
jgi:hypothetical protein